MKRREFIKVSALAPVALAVSAKFGLGDDKPSKHTGQAPPGIKKMTAAEFAAFKEAPEQEFKLSSLSASEQQLARNITTISNALMIKGALHRIDPKAYPVSADAKSLDAIAAAAARKLDARTFARVRPRLQAAMTDTSRLSKVLGPLSRVNFQKADLSPTLFETMRVPLKDWSPPRAEVHVQAPGAKYNRLHLQVRALHCVDETDPEGGSGTTDDMVLGGVVVGAGGSTGTANTIVCGEFNDDTRWDYGSYLFFNYSLHSKPGYSKTFYCVFQLVESDSDDYAVAQALSQTLTNIGTIAATAAGGAGAGAVAGAVLGNFTSFLPLFFDEDLMNPYSLCLTLNSENQFGGPDSGRLATPNIGGHLGAYRIGYRWHLAG